MSQVEPEVVFGFVSVSKQLTVSGLLSLTVRLYDIESLFNESVQELTRSHPPLSVVGNRLCPVVQNWVEVVRAVLRSLTSDCHSQPDGVAPEFTVP